MGLILASTLSFSCMSALARVSSHAFRPDALMFLRCAIQSACILPWIWVFWPRAGMRWATVRAHFVRGAVGVVSMWFLYSALGHLPLGMVSLLTMTSALWAGVLAHLFLGERQALGHLSFAGVALVGVAITLWPEPGDWKLNPWGVAAALAAGFSMGTAQMLVRQMGQSFGTREIVFWFGVAGMLFSAPAYFFKPQWPHTPQEVVWILGLGITALGGQLLMTRGFRYCTTLPGSLCVLFGSVWNVLLGLVFLGELPPARFWIGGTLAAGGIGVWMVSAAPPEARRLLVNRAALIIGRAVGRI